MLTTVSQSDELPCCGTFLLHQGIQRRVVLTIVQDGRTDLQWMDVHALTIGCVRNTSEQKTMEGERGILSLNATVVPCTRQHEDTRFSTVYTQELFNGLMVIGMIDDHDECEWVNVSSGTGSPELSRTKSTEL